MSLLTKIKQLTPRQRNLINLGLVLGVFVVVLVVMAIKGDLQRLGPAMRHAHKGWLVAAMLCMLLYLGVEALTLIISTRILNLRLSARDLIGIALLGHLFTNLTPFASGGQPAQAWALVNKGAQPGLASSALLARLFFYQLALTLVAAALLYLRIDFFKSNYGGFTIVAIIAFLVHAAVLLVLVGVAVSPTFVKRFAQALLRVLARPLHMKRARVVHYHQRIDAEITAFKRSFKSMRRAASELGVLFVVSVVQLIILYSVPYCIICALGISDINYVTCLAAAAFVTLIATAAPVPGGAGGAEGCFALFFSSITTATGVTGITLLLWRFVTYYLPILLEIPCLKYVGKPPAELTRRV